MRISKLLFVLATTGVLAVISDSPAGAGSSTANLNVSATVGANCTISTVAVGFPTYDPIVTHASSPDNSTSGSVTITCTKGSGTSIGLSLGANPSAAPVKPQMKSSGGELLQYMLYSDSGYSAVWSGASLSVVAAPSKAPRTYTVYGQIPGGQDVTATSYTDTVVATINF